MATQEMVRKPAYQPFITQGVVECIDFNAHAEGYETQDIQRLFKKVDYYSHNGKMVVVVLREIHYLTTQAFAALYEYISENKALFIISDSDRSRIFPPLLQICQTAG